jgi:hypothetical protein
MHRRRLILLLSVLALPAVAAGPSDIGIVLMHGKQGSPDRLITGLASQLEGAGYRVERPEMCFSGRRIYDLAYQDCYATLMLRSHGCERPAHGVSSWRGSRSAATWRSAMARHIPAWLA